MNKIYKFSWDVTIDKNVHSVSGVFIATDQEIVDLMGETIRIDLDNKDLPFIWGEVEAHDITMIVDDQTIVESMYNSHGNNITGINPLECDLWC